MSRPKFFRDPIHMQLRFEPVDLAAEIPAHPHNKRLSWLLRRLIDTETFQRLRFIRQNGLANLVFHGAEHSRFSHSMGVLFLARTMYHKVMRNMDLESSDIDETCVTTAALLHDVGHGPFSHTLEEILGDFDIKFDHEVMTTRIISEDDSEVCKLLKCYDEELPKRLVPYFDKKKRQEDSWIYKIVSSQLDGDRLDYLLRDAFFSGIRGPGFDLHRLLDLLHCHDNKSIAVERGGVEAVEAYLVTLDQMYRNVYYHHAVRAASRVLTSSVRRAFELDRNGDKKIFPGGGQHPVKKLIEEGSNVPLPIYVKLTESSLWSLIDYWREHRDPVLSDLCNRLFCRKLFKTINLSDERPKNIMALVERAKQHARKSFGYLTDETVDYYVMIDEPSRTSYKSYNWSPESADDSIWLIGKGKEPRPIEAERERSVLEGLRQQRYFSRLIVPDVVRDALET